MQRVVDNVIVRLVVYYAAISAAYVGLLRFVPGLDDAVARERARVITTTALGSSGGSIGALPPPTDMDALALIALTLVGALLVAFPVALVYQWTNEPEAYRPDFSRSLLVLPVAVALAVFLVKDSLALAFGLSGIVAVIRWRTTLRESMDGVFMFVVIGIGLAAGVQLLIVALVGSIVFNLTIVALSRARFASRPRRIGGWTLTERAAEQRPPRQTIGIRVDASNKARAEEHLATVLPLCAKEWRKSAELAQPNGRVLLEYRITLKKSQSPDSLVSTLSRLGIPEIGGVALTTET
jgi:hypothetical protein